MELHNNQLFFQEIFTDYLSHSLQVISNALFVLCTRTTQQRDQTKFIMKNKYESEQEQPSLIINC